MQQNKRGDLIIILFLFSLFLLSSPFTLWLIEYSRLWFLPYVLWGLIIGFTAVLNFKYSR
ncbi:MAG: hypothetical protein EP297_07405 [Gammaproteobacteria bacterium]|nr:MAG: hypothetical protein EP297_07405 [Gammaproteobacteria bacterium]